MDKNKISSIVFYFSILAFIIAFNFAHNPPSGWYEQFLPNIGNRTISDIFFLDSLTGWAVTPYRQQQNDTAYVLKTINGGDNWFIAYSRTEKYVGFERIFFLNANTGFTCGTNDLFSGYTGLSKSTDGGSNWVSLNVPDPFVQFDDMSILNEDTIWLAASSGFTGGVFRTTNAGMNWTHQINLSGNNPDHIYMYNSRIGFIATGNGTFKTTNGGVNWFDLSVTSFTDMYFIDSLTGWKNNGVATFFQKTINGGLNWVTYNLPPKGGIIDLSRIIRFDNVNHDTIWAAGSVAFLGPGQVRGLLYKSTNGGQSWGYQLPDTSIHSGQYQHIQFADKLKGWAYWGVGGIHTIVGGDTTIFTSVKSVNTAIPDAFKLFQNYPNPFNPESKIEYSIAKNSKVKINVFDQIGREIKTLINKKQNSGVYEVTFDGTDLPTGVYFYSLFIDGVIAETKKMVLLK